MDTRSLSTLDDYSKFHQNTTPALLSENIASFVSTAASATRLSLKATQALTDLAFEVAKYGTSAGLGISRRALVQAISTARYLHIFGQNDLALQAVTGDVSDLFLQTLEKYTNYGINIIHHTFSLAELLALAGFHITARVVTGGLMAAEELVRVLDGLFGSTETSRALAAVVHLVRKEIYEDEDFKPVASLGKLAVLARITTALTAYACLQNATHSRSMNRVRMTLLYRGEVPVGINIRRAGPALPFASPSSTSPSYASTKNRGAIPISVSRTATLSESGSPKPSTSSESTYIDSLPTRIREPEQPATTDFEREVTEHEFTWEIESVYSRAESEDPTEFVPDECSNGGEGSSPTATGEAYYSATRSIDIEHCSFPSMHSVETMRTHYEESILRYHHHKNGPYGSPSRPNKPLPASSIPRHTPTSSCITSVDGMSVHGDNHVLLRPAANTVSVPPSPRSTYFPPSSKQSNGNSKGPRKHSAPLQSLMPEQPNMHTGTTGQRRSGIPYYLKPTECTSTTSISTSESGVSINMTSTSSQSRTLKSTECRKTNIPQRVASRNGSSGSESPASVYGKAHRSSPKRNNENASSPERRERQTPIPEAKRSPEPVSCNNCKHSNASKSLSLLFDSMNRQLLASSKKKVRVKVREVKSTKITERSKTTRRSPDVPSCSNPPVNIPSIPAKSKPTTKLHTLSTERHNDSRRNTQTQHMSRSSNDGRKSPDSVLVPSTRPSPKRSVSPLHAKRKRSDGEFFPHYPHFPDLPFLQNLWRFLRYSTAAYGAALMSLVGVGQVDDLLHLPARIPAPQFLGSGQCGHHPNHHAFARHTSLPVTSILLSSFSTPGNADCEAENPSKQEAPSTDATSPNLLLTPPKMHALVHYVVVDHMACAIVLTCRGTLGLSDLLTDATCSYEELSLHGEKHRAHAGILRSARMLGRPGGKAMRTLKKAMEEYEGYGLVLTGHSLGGAVAAMLAMLWSEPVAGVQEEGLDDQAEYKDTNGEGAESCRDEDNFGRKGDRQRDHRHRRFVTSRESGLPPGRPVHCYGFGVPAVGSISLSRACLGLVTTVIHNTDIVPCLSLGLVRDFKNVAVSLWWEAIANPKRSKVSAESIIRRALGVRSKQTAADCPSPAEKKAQETGRKSWEQESGGQKSDNDVEITDEEWLWVVMKTLRANMSSEKLVPPGAVFIVSSHLAPNDASPPSTPSSNLATSFLQRSLGLPAPPSLPNNPTQIRKATLHRVEDVEVRFSEIHFSKSMFSDHSVKGYEEAVGCLVDGWTPSGQQGNSKSSDSSSSDA